ncbi:tetraspanin-1-like [Megalops cyprinoides]|uniref:tetraspanin-1-like n=1 Tax=Megalops cyprinoides TaxID=118141 RepID=UPI00186486E9|nr:tetraspanin-1-like [Megalops cyprinoides]
MGCFGFLKVMMFLFNGIIFLAGGAILGVGVWVKVDSGSLLGVLEEIEDAPAELDQLLNVGYLLIAVGGVLLLMGFLGCCGAMKESRCMLLMFFVIVLLVFIAEVAGAIVVLVFQPLAEDLIKKVGDKAVEVIKRDYGTNSDITGLWNATMDGLDCCGFYDYTDFTHSPFNNITTAYPTECCKLGPCTLQNAMRTNATGCFPKLVELIEDNSVILGAVALGIAALEIAAMAVSMSMYRHIGSKRG